MPSTVSLDPLAETQRLQDIFARQRQAFRDDDLPDAALRRQALQRLQNSLLTHIDQLTQAVSADFGNRSAYETRFLEMSPSIEGIKHARHHVKRWMRTERRPVSIWFKPAKARVMYQPLGVIGIIVPWNYPIYLAIGPLTSALAAGNRVLLKMSEFTPRTGIALQTILGQVFTEEEVAVINGGVEVAQAFAQLPFDHLLFTGSTAVGRLVMQAASVNLTPVTLELGGKSPAIIGADADLAQATERILAGKLLNAGQTCVAPDYVLLTAAQEPRFSELAQQTAARFYPTLQDNPHYTSIASERQYQRLQKWLRDALDKGANLVELKPAGETLTADNRKIAPTLVFNTSPDMLVMQEEIFGPILPVVRYRTLADAVSYVNDRPRPLALYYFGKDKEQIRYVLEKTTSGGVSINDTVLHVAQDDLPFGGVGASGMGHYHGKEGFETFSKKKGLFYQHRFSSFSLLYPPYGKLADMLLKLMLRR